MKKQIKNLLNFFEMGPQTELFKTPLFLVLGVMPFFAGLGAFLCILLNEAIFLPFKFSSEGFRNLADLYTIPAAFIAVGLSLAGLCALNLTSVQTREQIKQSISQNNLSNYFKHAEEFATFLAGKSDLPITHMSAREHHRQIFPNAMKGDFSVDPRTLTGFDYSLKQIRAKVEDLNESAASGNQMNMPHHGGHPVVGLLWDINTMSNLFEIRAVKRKVFINPRKPEGAMGSLFDLFHEAFAIVNLMDSFFQFSPEYKQPESLKFFLRIEFSKISTERIADVRYAFSIPMREVPV